MVVAFAAAVCAVEVGLFFGHEDAFEGRELGNFFCAEVSGFVEHEAVAVAENVGREPAVEAEAACADDGSEARFNEGLAGLEVLACDGHFGLFGEFPHGGYVDGGVGGTHDEGSAFGEGCVGVAHRGSDVFAVVGLHCSFESFESVVDVFVYGHVYFGRCSPEYHHAVKVLFGLEVADIFAELFYEFPACAGFYVFAVEAGSVVGVEGGLEGLDGFEFVANGLDVFFFEHFGVD